MHTTPAAEPAMTEQRSSMAATGIGRSATMLVRTCAAALLLGLPAIAAHAQPAAQAPAGSQAFPAGPVRIVVPFAPGGSTDAMARIVAQRLGDRIRQPVLVENRAGANGTIGAAHVAKAPGDGRTLLLVQAGYASNPSLFKNLPYDQSRDLLPVTNLASGPLVLVVHPSLPVRSVKELVALARAKPGALNVGVPGTGSLNHLAAELFNLNTGIRTTSVPYKGTGGALADVLAGNVEAYYMNLVLSVPYVKSGKLRALGVTSAQRSTIAPDLPAIAEAGVRDFDLTTWFGLLAPGTTPREVIGRVQSEVVQVLGLADVRERMAGDGLTVVGDTPEQFATFLAAETAKAARIIKAAGISVGQ
ncbi:MAG: tripartite tricarboxylate transporter substrate binding protein [Rhodocyclaceae bacterium]|nr:tripartite tricarboxylate transporter substrate binding protein [Rhodocyclaceae bacterium]MCA3090700.1 tripartite tricarboxylate transporter substrate binding protein [Rhodocyclaceae bacterium]MCA3094926.1 tripartite tricarboxylate transporter substrate binding protein [Rhodocyclaceae bacterium]MCA3099269.1 tripartite tricarboxylate transporter substrate binding protein [Rhodocyclaceae bacterium]MCA3102657.1 tripartite tricarboxylate transporter substrate binding protein [Rhodocyclaceae bact